MFTVEHCCRPSLCNYPSFSLFYETGFQSVPLAFSLEKNGI